MKRMTTICKGAALLLAVALLTLPLLGLAAPAAEARTLDSATVSGNDAPTVGDSATPPTESGDPAPEPPACFCDVKCTATTLNADCPACVADLAACKGKEPEKCSCETKCADGAANGACPVCVADVSKCAGKEPAPPVCACSVKCAAGAKRVLSVALNHARKYHFIETNAARDTLTKFGKGDKTPDPYTPEQVRALLERVAGTEWEMPVVLGGLYGMRRSEVLGLRWRNVDLEKGTFDVVEQLPFHVPPKTTVIEEMAPPKSNGRRLPITDVARPFFERQLARLDTQRRDAEKAGTPYYDNDLVICKANGAPQAANWISSGFGKLLAGLDMPHIRYHDLRHTAATNMHQLTGDFYTVGEVLGHTLAGIGASLGLSMNFEAVTARYVDVRLERKQEVLDAYHAAVHPKPKQARQTTPKQEKQTPKRKAPEMTL